MDSPKTSAVRFFLSAALSPRVQSASRWTAVNAASRKAYAITGKDSGSPFLGYLASGRDRIESPAYGGAIKSLGIDETIYANGFLDWYRKLNHGYPFLDYSKDEAQLIDTTLMETYAETHEAPPITTVRLAANYKLAEGRIEPASGIPQQATENLVAAWLRAAAGITETRRLSHSTVTFRTSPSGGARHPTDLCAHLSGAWPAGLVGSWWYDPLQHSLTASESSQHPFKQTSPATLAIFTVSSHVRRAMWRYRDVRAFRPVAIDAGHVVETLLTVIAYSGWTGWWQPAAGFVEAAGEFDPVFGYVIATPDGSSPPEVSIEVSVPRGSLWTGPWRTNPLISLTATKEGVVAENHLNQRPPLRLTPSMVNTLAYATPSSRRDRPTNLSDIRGKYATAVADLDGLIDGGFLQPIAEGDRLWRLMQTWSEHDWFLSLLAHASEVAGSTRMLPPLFGPVTSWSSSLPQALDLRRTSRALSSAPLPTRTSTNLLTSLAMPSRGIKVVLSTEHRMGSLERGTYVLRDGRFEFQMNKVPSEEEVVTAAIGQPWARGFSCTVWLIPEPAPDPGSWEASLIECGRVAQRLALALCDEPRIGIFQSPALVDEKLADVLTGHVSIDGAYLVGVGLKDQIASIVTTPGFQPSSLFEQREGAGS